MMFLSDDFLLGSEPARVLFHEHAARMPIFDYHCHLPPADIAQDRAFENLTAIWLAGDHYKWRAMRANGVPERLITGGASDEEKFQAWAATVPATVGNPLYHWTHMELKRPFGIAGRLLGPDTARAIYEECGAMLAAPEFRARGLLARAGVRVVCTTDDPADTLEHHRAIAADAGFAIKVLPTFRPDKAMGIESPEAFNAWAAALEERAGIAIRDYPSFLEALRARHAFFDAAGCRIADHGMTAVHADEATEHELRTIFNKVRIGKPPDEKEAAKWRAALLVEFGRMHAERGWAMQLHIGALRNTSSRAAAALGPDTGFDSIADEPVAAPLARLLDRLDREEKLPKTILYVLNPRDNEAAAAMCGNFQDGTAPGKIQFGPAWWFNDQKDGIERQLGALSVMGLLSRFAGMVTDSRSFLSYSRHEYFRRILCNLLGGQVARGELPDDMELLGGVVRDIAYRNAVRYFGVGEIE